MIGDFALLNNVRRLAVRHTVRESNWAARLVAVIFLLIGLAFAIGSYLLYYTYFVRLLHDDLGGPLLARYVLDSAFALILFLGVISFTVSATGILYRSREVRLLFSLPIPPWKIFFHRFFIVTAMSAWPVVFLGIPAVCALGTVLGASLPFYLYAFLSLLLFIVFIAVAGGILSFLISWPAARVRSGLLWAMESTVAVFAVIWLIQRIIPRAIFSLFYVVNAAQAGLVAERINSIFSPIPSHYFVDLLALVLPANGLAVSPALAVLKAVGLVAVGLLVLFLLAKRFYLSAWRLHDQGNFAARDEDAPPIEPRSPFPRLFRYQHSYLFEKELLVLGRDSEALSRGGFIIFLMVLYLMIAGAMSRLQAFAAPERFSTLVAFVFAVIGYFALTLGLRFVFPSLSLEGRAAWVVWSSPLHQHEVFSWKLFFWTVATYVPLALAVVLSSVIFGLPASLLAFLLFAVFCVTATLVAVCLGQGFLFPNFREANPDRLATSPAGLMTVGVGLAYLWVASRYVRQFVLTWLEQRQADHNVIFGLLIVTIAVIALYWVLAPRRLERLEIG